MSGFSADWLALRASADAAARDIGLARRFARALGPRARVADLGAGTGALHRWLSPFLPKGTAWTLIDGDAALLAQAPGHARKRRQSLAGRLPAADGYVSTALIDLCGAAWLARLVRRARGRPLLMMLGVDGRHALVPPDPRDAAIFAAFAAHQRRVKGLGPALGGAAPFAFARLAAKAGYSVRVARSDWRLADGPLLRETLAGIAAAAAEQEQALDTASWLTARLAVRNLELTVGHRDVLAVARRRRPNGRPA
jgi:SAM-dependent methyltransferase